MSRAAPDWDEKERLRAVERYAILDTPTEPDFDDIVRLAADSLDAPIAVVNLIADGRQWFKAEVGIGARELPLEVSICAHALLEESMMVVPDTLLDPRFACNPLVATEGGLRFYAGALLRTPEGLPIGTVCVLDRRPRPDGITEHQRRTLTVLARQVMTQLELRRTIAAMEARAEQVAVEAREREAAQAALRLSQDRYGKLFSALDAGCCIVELTFDAAGTAIDYRFVEANPAFVRQAGPGRAGEGWRRQLAPDREEHRLAVYGTVARTGETARFEQGSEAPDGRWHDVFAFRIGEPDERQVAILFNDITERRRAERALQKLNQQLDARVLEAVSAREEARDAQRQSQKLEAIGQLTGGVAHDFNNLLTVIRGSVELLRRGDLSEQRRARYIDAIGTTADRAANLTGQLLAFARRQSLNPILFDAGQSLREVAQMIETLIGSRIVLDIQVPRETCYIVADRSQFDTAIVNMSINARDAMAGAGTLTIATGPVARIPAIRAHEPVAGEFIAVTITDTGSGIPADALARIFEPFYTTKSVGEGTGLGLSQVIGFAKQSGGDIRVESVEGAGTAFTLYLPRARPDAAPAGAEPERAAEPPGDGVCVLVVEDNEQVGSFAAQALKELGYDSVMTLGAREALEALASDRDRFHIVFSDVMMPGMSGLELGEEIRRVYPGMPVVLTSGYSHVLARDGQHGFELLNKPYSVEQLSRVLRKAIRRREPVA